MKTLLLAIGTILSSTLYAQTPEDFAIEIEPLIIPDAPGVHSYAFGITSDEKWVILGGRIDGLHRRQPWAAFLEADNNKNVFVIDPVAEQVWSSDLSVLPAVIFEQIQSTNQEFYQKDTMLYVIGGYGYSAVNGGHMTFPNLTAVSIDELANAVINNTSVTPYFRQITDLNLKVTGGQLGYLDGTYYLVGGQLFDGAYNPMGPTHGPGFTQIYTNEIRTFEILDDGTNLSIQNYAAQHDTVNLHRRDYNMAPQIFPNGDYGFTAFSGVFDYSDMPYLNSVDITDAGYTVNNSFNQYLSQYHSAKLPAYDANANTMHTLFFGGLSQFTLDNQNVLVEDVDVPFVKTISRVTRDPSGAMQEVKLNYIEMPSLVGTGAEFLPVSQYHPSHKILDLNSIPQTKTLVGYIFGGIESSAENIFFVNDGTQSSASNVIFKVFINKETSSLDEVALTGGQVLDLEMYPVPARNKLTLEFYAPNNKDFVVRILDSSGKIVQEEAYSFEFNGWQKEKLNVSKLAKGNYILILTDGVNEEHRSFIKR
jgi:hypothetical protein